MLNAERIASRMIAERSEFPANSTHSTVKGSSLEIPATFDSRAEPSWPGNCETNFNDVLHVATCMYVNFDRGMEFRGRVPARATPSKSKPSLLLLCIVLSVLIFSPRNF